MRSDKRSPIPNDQKVLIGKPAHALSQADRLALDKAIDRLPQCLEVHVPQYFVIGAMQAPRLVLVLVVRDDEDREAIAQKVHILLAECLPESMTIDTWVITGDDSLLPAIRRACCQYQERV